MKRRRNETRASEEFETRKKPRISGFKPSQWLRGRLCPKTNEKSLFIRPMTELPEGYNKSKDVFMYPDCIPQFILSVVERDVLEFTLGERDKTRPMATKVRISQYSQRTCEELIDYMRKLAQDINSDNFKKLIVQVLPCTALWSFLGSPVFKRLSDAEFTHVTYVEVFLSLLKQFLHHGKSYKNLLEEVIKTVALGTIFQDTNNRSLPAIIKSCNYSNDSFCVEGRKVSLSAELVRSFCHNAISQVPSVTRCLLPTLNAISMKTATPATQRFLYDLLSLNAIGENSFVTNALTWKELPLIPTDHELAGNLVEEDQHLSPVRTDVPYENPEQYMDTYFRLLRAETFSAIQHGIKDLKASKLDPRDMNVYHNIHLAGFKFQGGRFSLAIHFTTEKKVKKWEASAQLIYGNLICLSLNQQFDDVIWATVSNRDAELLNKHQIIMLELLDENIKSVSEIINSLQTWAGFAVMVESRTYYQSLSPILRRLKAFDMENFPLKKEIIYAKSTHELPSYLKEATFQTAIVFHDDIFDEEMDISEAREEEEVGPSTPTYEKTLLYSSELEDEDSDSSILKATKREKFVIWSSLSPCCSSSSMESLDAPLDFDEKSDAEAVLQKLITDHVNSSTTMNSCGSQDVICSDERRERIDSEKLIEAKQLDDFDDSACIDALSDNPFCASSPREPRDACSQERLGGRMNVERFLETFNSNSESLLEASQSEALIHALQNRLAIIQGPPGCGKTFIGVKIVQLLLSLKPKLEKPILLLTYKNHALDEFLKHTMRFCEKDDLVRIGGRSKEPELESCNLKNVFPRNFTSYDLETHHEIQKFNDEIAQIEWKITEISSAVEASCYLTKGNLFDELTEEQLQSLVVKADWKRAPMQYRLNWNGTAIKSWTEYWLKDVYEFIGSLKDLIQVVLGQESVNNEAGVDCVKIFEDAFKKWVPERHEIQRIKKFQAQLNLPIQCVSTGDEKDMSKASNNGNEDDSGDEEYVRQLLETRMDSGFRQEKSSINDYFPFNPVDRKNETDILVEISDFPPDMKICSQVRHVNDLWSLNKTQRLHFLYCILKERATRVSQDLNDLLKQLQSLKNRRQEIEMNDKVEMLSKKKLIGVTITGASINHDLIRHIGPRVVIVEEAAEILEPSLLAALTPSIEHLILIGDHKQLRAQVDTYDLCKNFHFDVSMMERLIDSGFPYERLTRQNRMRPEFSALLRDIYPDLQDNVPLVSQNKPLKCIEKSMFFWSHDYPEKKERTITNVQEADRVIALVLYLLSSGCQPSEITVLAAYLGQTKLLRNMIKKEKSKRPKLFQETDKSSKGFVQVQTIDMYQGDENKYVIISLVRSNKKNGIGFLKKMNRRCVAQSRAMCGMYFVGNENTLCSAKNSCWSRLINSMKDQNCVAKEIPLQCPKHDKSKNHATDADSILSVIANRELLCRQPCGVPCFQPEKHPCKTPCFEEHEHHCCTEKVADKFLDCDHPVERKCYETIFDLRCEYKTNVELPCGHEGEKKCCEEVRDVVCRIPVTAIFPRCKHQTEKECHLKIETMSCKHPCGKMNSCGKHLCKDLCGKNHGHDRCPEMIDYRFPKCNHPSPKQKKCSQEIRWNCEHKEYITGACGHKIEKKCYQNESEVKCEVTPCERTRVCGHPCTNACGDDCDKGECKHCQRVHEQKMKEFHEAAKRRYFELEEKIKRKEIPPFSIHEIRDTDSSAAEYKKVKDLVLKFIQPCHKWFPTITKIEKVTNLVLEHKFEAAKSRAHGDNIDRKFHGTSNSGVLSIIKNGFKMPEANPRPPKKRGMFGQGIYFATDSSKSAQEIYTKGSQKLLLCEVILGKSMTVDKADNSLNRKKVFSKGYDSVYAPRGTAVKNDEFVIFHPDQALPQYIIHFSDSKTFVPPSPSSLTTQSVVVKNMLPSRTVDFQDPFEMYCSYAESHFRRMVAKGANLSSSSLQANISSIDIVINKDLEQKFEATRQKFKSQGIPDREVLAYHGTDKKNIDSILKSNLQLSYAKRQVYGRGNYFSEFPAVSVKYGDGLILCRILPGKEFVNSSPCDIPAGFNSKKVFINRHQPADATAASASGEMIIIENSDQILPFFVIHR